MNGFVIDVVTQFSNLISDINFRQTIFANIERFTRFELEKELKRRILVESRTWWKENVANIFKSTVMMSFIETLQRADIHFDLSLTNEKLEGLGDLIDVDNTLWTKIKSFFPGGGGAAGGIALSRVLAFPFALLGLSTAGFFVGMFIKGAIKYKVLSSFQSVCIEMFKDIVEDIKEEDIAQIVHNRYATQIKCIVNDFLEESVKHMVYDLEADIKRLIARLESCRRNNASLESFLLNVEKCKLRIKKIENFEHSIE